MGQAVRDLRGERPHSEEPIRYGIVKQLGSFNLLWAVFHEWIGMLGDIWRSPWKHKLSYLLREPGWSHDGSRETSDMIRARWQEQQQRADATPADTTQDEPQKPIAGPRRAA